MTTNDPTAWIGSGERMADAMDPGHAARIAATLGAPAPGQGEGRVAVARRHVQRRSNHAAVKNALRPVTDHHRLIIKAELGKRLFIALQFETEGTVKRHVIHKDLAHHVEYRFGR